MRKGRLIALLAIGTVLLAGSAFCVFGRGIWFPLLLQIRGERTVAGVIARARDPSSLRSFGMN